MISKGNIEESIPNKVVFMLFFMLSYQTERDVSVRQRAVDLLYVMCDQSNATEIVQEMLVYLKQADFGIREELVSKFH